MSNPGLHHRSARTRQTIAQIALGALALPAIVLATGIGVPHDPPAEIPELVLPTPKDDAPSETGRPSRPRIDPEALAANLSKIANPPKPKPAGTPEGGAGETTAAATPTAPIRFLGSMLHDLSRAALLVVDGKQRVLSEGEKSGDLTLVVVESDHVVIRKGGGPDQRLELAPRTGPVVGSAPLNPTHAAATMPHNETSEAQPIPGGQLSGGAPGQALRPDDVERRRLEALEVIRNRDPRRTPPGTRSQIPTPAAQPRVEPQPEPNP
jgi:hypothetical protein